MNQEYETIPKPLSVALNETREKIANVINESNLHASLLEMIVKELYLDIRRQADVIAERERIAYEESVLQKNSEPGIE